MRRVGDANEEYHAKMRFRMFSFFFQKKKKWSKLELELVLSPTNFAHFAPAALWNSSVGLVSQNKKQPTRNAHEVSQDTQKLRG